MKVNYIFLFIGKLYFSIAKTELSYIIHAQGVKMKNHWLDKRHIWKIDDGELHWFSAKTSEEALKMYSVEFQFGSEDLEDLFVEKLNEDVMISIRMDEDGDAVIEQTAREWAKSNEGMIGSTLY